MVAYAWPTVVMGDGGTMLAVGGDINKSSCSGSGSGNDKALMKTIIVKKDEEKEKMR